MSVHFGGVSLEDSCVSVWCLGLPTTPGCAGGSASAPTTSSSSSGPGAVLTGRCLVIDACHGMAVCFNACARLWGARQVLVPLSVTSHTRSRILCVTVALFSFSTVSLVQFFNQLDGRLTRLVMYTRSPFAKSACSASRCCNACSSASRRCVRRFRARSSSVNSVMAHSLSIHCSVLFSLIFFSRNNVIVSTKNDGDSGNLPCTR
jgi:hypothetical protein